MKIFPAIDLFQGAAVRLLRGDYEKMTVYDRDPLDRVRIFEAAGASSLHMVDLEGAKSGTSPNIETVRRIISNTNLFVQVGGGIRSVETAERYLNAGAQRIILGTAAAEDPDFVQRAVNRFGDAVAVGADIRNGLIAVHGWTKSTNIDCNDFCRRMRDLGIKTMIVTDISKDGAMQGTNLDLYRSLQKQFDINFIASGGVTDINDVRMLLQSGIYGTIIGRACYNGGIDLAQAIREAET